VTDHDQGTRTSGTRSRFEARVAPDGRILELTEIVPAGAARAVSPNSPEGVSILRAGHDILYRFDDERRVRDLTYAALLEGMQQEVLLALHKVRHPELLDEPELVPILRRLLRDLESTAQTFREACRNISADA